MKERTTVMIIADGKDMQFDISRSATCDDVITKGTDQVLLPNSTKFNTFFESAGREQKMLSGHTNILKQCHSCGSCKQNFTLDMKAFVKSKSKMTLLSRAKTKLRRLGCQIMKRTVKVGQKYEADFHEDLNTNAADKGKHICDKTIPVLGKSANTRPLPTGHGKKELLERYLTDAVEYHSFDDVYNDGDLASKATDEGSENDSFMESQLPERTRGDGEENTSYSQIAELENVMNLGFINEISEHENFMNMGFLRFDHRTETMSFSLRDELNERVIYYDGDTDSNEATNSSEEDSDYDSLCELERNVLENNSQITYSNTTEIERVCSNVDLHSRITEDIILDSLMHTFVNGDIGDNDDDTNGDDYSDEGISSVDSDFD